MDVSSTEPTADLAVAQCSCCGRTYARKRLHALGDTGAHICRRCGLYVAVRLKVDPLDR